MALGPLELVLHSLGSRILCFFPCILSLIISFCSLKCYCPFFLRIGRMWNLGKVRSKALGDLELQLLNRGMGSFQ